MIEILYTILYVYFLRFIKITYTKARKNIFLELFFNLFFCSKRTKIMNYQYFLSWLSLQSQEFNFFLLFLIQSFDKHY